jgi:ABC-type uncharacterized transport system permease subunit
MNGTAFILFALFALVLAGIYLSIRRNWFKPAVTAAAGVFVSIILMTLVSLVQTNYPLQSIISGLLVGGLFSGVTIAAAWHFQAQELRARYVEAERAAAE